MRKKCSRIRKSGRRTSGSRNRRRVGCHDLATLDLAVGRRRGAAVAISGRRLCGWRVSAGDGGRLRRWRWVHNPWFRCLHLLAIAYVALQAWLDAVCPLTQPEMALRARAGAAVYEVSFVGHWLQIALYYEAPARVFTAGYTLFALLVAFAWGSAPPRPSGDHARPDTPR